MMEATKDAVKSNGQRAISACVSTKRFSAERKETPVKFKANAELSIPDVEVFYSAGIKGYTDYPFWEKSMGV